LQIVGGLPARTHLTPGSVNAFSRAPHQFVSSRAERNSGKGSATRSAGFAADDATKSNQVGFIFAGAEGEASKFRQMKLATPRFCAKLHKSVMGCILSGATARKCHVTDIHIFLRRLRTSLGIGVIGASQIRR